jgi:hypothetical protein
VTTVDATPRPSRLSPAACLRRLPEPALDIDEHDNPLTDSRRVELRRSVLTLAEVNHVAEIRLVQAVVERLRRGGAR